MHSHHFRRTSAIAAVTVITIAAAARTVAGQESATSSLTIFVRSAPIGSEQVAVARTADGWTITGSGRVNAPLDIVTRRVQVRYDADWKARELTIDASVRGQPQLIHSTVAGSGVTTDITRGADKSTTTLAGSAELLLLNMSFVPYEALAARLKTAATGSTIPAFVAPAILVNVRVGESTNERIETGTQTIEVRRTHVTLAPTDPATSSVEADIWADQQGRLLRLSIPAQQIEVAREDIASVAARRVPISRPNDEPIRIPSNGFTLAGTISKPAQPASTKLPGVVLVGGGGPTDRDGLAYGIPVLGQLAGAIADGGFITLRYDKRGVGQSGGRIESAAFADFAEDLRAAVKLLSERKDVDPKRIAVIGHSEGGSIALLAAAKDKRITAVGLLATNGIAGSDLVLEQQQHLLGRTGLSESEKQAKVEMQKQINAAVISGKGWETLPPEARRQADTAEFQSLLAHDPAKVLPNVRQPILIVQGELDTQVAPANADKLQTLALKRKNAGAVEVVKLPGVNHLLVPATTGEAEEYLALKEKRVSPAVFSAVVNWLQKIFAAEQR